jgi:hypothetical protein
MDARPLSSPSYMATGDSVQLTTEYRVVFWEHQLPPEGSAIASEQMAWACYSLDLTGLQDVYEAIEWADEHIDSFFDRPTGRESHGERLYVLYAKVPGENRYLHLAGWNPTSARGSQNLRRAPRV